MNHGRLLPCSLRLDIHVHKIFPIRLSKSRIANRGPLTPILRRHAILIMSRPNLWQISRSSTTLSNHFGDGRQGAGGDRLGFR
jgi:hypothetical protein